MIYEYQCIDPNKSCEKCIERFDVYTSILSEDLKVCPNCGNPVEKKVSLISACIFLGKQMNQYSDVKHAKYWRDKNGVRHKVTDADGSSNSPTVSKRVTASPDQIESRIKKDKEQTKKEMSRIRHYWKKKD